MGIVAYSPSVLVFESSLKPRFQMIIYKSVRPTPSGKLVQHNLPTPFPHCSLCHAKQSLVKDQEDWFKTIILSAIHLFDRQC